MAPRSQTASHIVSRVERARRTDPTLTYKQAAKELGISESSLYKMRAGTRTGQGSIYQRVFQRTKPGGIQNAYTVTFKSGDRVASRNVDVLDAPTQSSESK